MALIFSNKVVGYHDKGKPGVVPTLILNPSHPYSVGREAADADERYLPVTGPESVLIEDPVDQMVIKAFNWNLEHARRAKAPHQAVWDDAWRLYNNEWDFTDKEEWQSARRLPKVTMTVERLSAVLTRILSMSRQWFSVTTENPDKEVWVNVARDLVAQYMSHEKVNFFLLFQDAIKVALLSNIMVAEVTCEVDGITDPEFDASPGGLEPIFPGLEQGGLFGKETPQRGPDTNPRWFPKIELRNPDRVFIDPTGRNRWISYRVSYTKGEFAAEAMQRAFDPDLVRKVLNESYSDLPLQTREKQKRQQTETVSTDDVTLDVFWGDLYDEKGRRLFKNRFFIVANEKYLVVRPTPNPFWHQKSPLVVAGLLRVPFSVYHKSLIGISLDAFELWVEFLNLLMDYFQALFLGQYAVRTDLLDPDEEGDELEWYPGKLWKQRGEGELISFVKTGDPNPQVWNYISTLSQELQEGTAMMDAMAGVPRTRGKLSSMEFTRRMAEGGVFFDFVFRQLEDNWIAIILKRFFQVILQYMPMDEWARWITTRQKKYASDPYLVQKLEEIKNLTPRERYDLLAHDLEFRTRVFSAVFDRQQEIEKITYMLGILGKVPQAAAHLKWSNILGKLIEAFGWDKDEMISPVPIQFMGDDPKNAGKQQAQNLQGSDGGQGVPGSPVTEGEINTSAGFLAGSAGGPPVGMEQLMPGVKRSGNPQPPGLGLQGA
jgi:hypothetical protein